MLYFFFFFQAEDGIRDVAVTGVQTCALPISRLPRLRARLPLGCAVRPWPRGGSRTTHRRSRRSAPCENGALGADDAGSECGRVLVRSRAESDRTPATVRWLGKIPICHGDAGGDEGGWAVERFGGLGPSPPN